MYTTNYPLHRWKTSVHWYSGYCSGVRTMNLTTRFQVRVDYTYMAQSHHGSLTDATRTRSSELKGCSNLMVELIQSRHLSLRTHVTREFLYNNCYYFCVVPHYQCESGRNEVNSHCMTVLRWHCHDILTLHYLIVETVCAHWLRENGHIHLFYTCEAVTPTSHKMRMTRIYRAFTKNYGQRNQVLKQLPHCFNICC